MCQSLQNSPKDGFTGFYSHCERFWGSCSCTLATLLQRNCGSFQLCSSTSLVPLLGMPASAHSLKAGSETVNKSKIRFLPSPSRANFIAVRVFPWYNSQIEAALLTAASSLAQSSLLPVICHVQSSSPQPLSSLSSPGAPLAPDHFPSAWFPHKGA